MRHVKLRAFTLIELLIVVAIISLLAAILFPAFASAKDRARQSGCTSNLKQIYLAMRQYSQDFDNCYPESKPLGDSAYRYIQDPLSYPALMNPYVKNSQIWFCPGQPSKFKDDNMPGYWWTKSASIARNPDDSEDGTNEINVLIWDNYAYKQPTPIGATTSPTQWASAEGRYCAHIGRTNFNALFFDGHVKLYPKKTAQSLCKLQAKL